MNKELYERLTNELNSIQNPFPGNVRPLLVENLKQGMGLEDVTAVITSFYEFTHGKDEYSFLENFYKNTFSSYYDIDRIENDFNKIANDEKLLDSILKICNEEVITNLYNYAYNQNAIYNKLGDNKYEVAFNKIKERYSEFATIKVSPEEKESEKISNATNLNNDTTINSNQNLTSNDPSLEEALLAFGATPIRNTANSQNLEELEKPQKSRGEIQKEEMLSNVARDIGVNKETLEKKLSDRGISLKNVSTIEVEPELVDKMSANSARVGTLFNNKFEKLVKRIKDEIKISKIVFQIKRGEVKTVSLKKKETVLDKIANCDNVLLSAIAKSAREKAQTFNSLVKVDDEVKQALVSTINNTNEKIKKKINKLRDNINDMVNNYREKKASIYANQIIAENTVEPQLSEMELANKVTGITDMEQRERNDWERESAFATMNDRDFAYMTNDADGIVKANTIKPQLSEMELANKVTGITDMEQRKRNDWAKESAFATMNDYDFNDLIEKSRLNNEKIIANAGTKVGTVNLEELKKGRTM